MEEDREDLVASRTFKKRVLSATVGIPILLGSSWYGDIYFLGVLVVIGVFCIDEFMRMLRIKGIRGSKGIAIISMVLFLLSSFYENIQYTDAVSFLLLSTLIWMVLKNNMEDRLVGAASTVLAALYVGWLLSYVILLRNMSQGNIWVWLLFIFIWSADTGAYFMGKRFGKKPFFRSLSPSKTLEGFIGAVVFPALAGGIASRFLTLYPLPLISIGAIVGVSSQIGDLVESAFKRSAGVKDSGNLIPGHGGFLDRFDSLLFVAPIFYYCVSLLRSGWPVW